MQKLEELGKVYLFLFMVLNMMFYDITQGNPGALTVLAEASKQCPDNALLLRDWGKNGSDLWVAYKEAGKNIETLIENAKKDCPNFASL